MHPRALAERARDAEQLLARLLLAVELGSQALLSQGPCCGLMNGRLNLGPMGKRFPNQWAPRHPDIACIAPACRRSLYSVLAVDQSPGLRA